MNYLFFLSPSFGLFPSRRRAEEEPENNRQNVVSVRGPEPAAVPAAVRILPFSGEFTAFINETSTRAELILITKLVFNQGGALHNATTTDRE